MTAAEALRLCSVGSLPVDCAAIAERLGIKLTDYATCARYYQCGMEQLYGRGALGLSFADREDEVYVIALNENVRSETRQRWSLAHELGHILLGHVCADSDLSNEEERAADCFAAELLAPLTVLHFCGVSSAAEIAAVCRISDAAAEARFRELQRLRSEDSRSYRMGGECSFLATEEQRECLRRFSGFISSYITRRQRQMCYPRAN